MVYRQVYVCNKITSLVLSRIMLSADGTAENGVLVSKKPHN